jgi:hypothetical protein
MPLLIRIARLSLRRAYIGFEQCGVHRMPALMSRRNDNTIFAVAFLL